MLPPVVATQIRDCIADYLRTTFRPTTPGFIDFIERFLNESSNTHKGPYLTIGLPFRPGIQAKFFPEIPLPFTPHRHQERAFERLTPPHYQSTLIATGTGSGKTECFLLPLLEHCRQAAPKPGIKALIIYPMNALATDQGKRIAQLIHQTPALRGKIRAGLYIGAQDDDPTLQMGAEKVITDKEILRSSPPDILLTNYKMLDYLLIQPRTQALWQHNHQDPESLRYIVVDEFHTFDGAQGTDLACLLRRLKARLNIPDEHLAYVGTSATLGSEPDAKAKILQYAGQIFGELFTMEGLIEEDRLTAVEFLDEAGESPPLRFPSPTRFPLAGADDPDTYRRQEVERWLGNPVTLQDCEPLSEAWCIEVGKILKIMPLVRSLIIKLGKESITYENCRDRLRTYCELPKNTPPEEIHFLLDSLLSVIAIARREIAKTDGQGVVLPWVTLRVQYWFRELKRMVASVEPEPKLLFSADLMARSAVAGTTTPPKTLPVLHCRDCGATGWGGVEPSQGANRLEANQLKQFYQAFFGKNPLVAYLFPCENPNPPETALICGQCLTLNRDEGHYPPGHHVESHHCRSCGNEHLIRVHRPLNTETVKQRLSLTQDCPYCQSKNGLSILGAQAASLTSAMISVLYTTPFNQDKQLLAFSDSVQDAAHRAGFYAARTYRTTVRTAIAQTVQAYPDGLRLKDLLDQFPHYWQQQLGSVTDYIATFMPTDMAWLREWDTFLKSDQKQLSPDSTLINPLNDRLTWEIVNQFGHRAAVGPSLERSGLCGVYFDPERRDRAVAQVHLMLTNEIENLPAIFPAQVEQFVLGMLHHLRLRGGILQPATVGKYITDGGNTFLWKRFIYMPAIGPNTPRPIFWVNASGAKTNGFEEVLRKNRKTWCQDWLNRNFRGISALFGDHTLDINLTLDQEIEIINKTLDILSQAQLLEIHKMEKGRAYGIPLNALWLQTEGNVLVCDRCHHQITAHALEQPHLEQMVCLNQNCTGHYHPDQRQELSYYSQIYRTGEVKRINAAEHTGLLERGEREALERRFIGRDRTCDPNLLSATSTLEMGINIGDLSTVFLNSVPPQTANFQQRIGRAGRKNGNALVNVVASGNFHDLYFYTQPTKMIDGKVEAAGCYLDAVAILQRQLIAFCLDCWIATGVTQSEFPLKLRDVVSAIGKPNPQRYPYNWLNFIEQHKEALITDFCNLFSDCTTPRTRDELHTFMTKGNHEKESIQYQIETSFTRIHHECRRLQSQIKSMKAKAKQLSEQPEALQDSDRIEQLDMEAKGFRSLLGSIHAKQTLNFLTDEGLLPNYAFPEAGVTLRSILWRRNNAKNQAEKTYETLPAMSYERPAQIAIRELVPNGVFYAQGRKVTIDQIDLNLSKPEDWRLCSHCNYAIPAFEPEAHAPNCPRCGNPMWSDQAQIRQLLKLRQVMATTSDRQSRFGDDSEERNVTFFQRHLLIDFRAEFLEKTFLINDDHFPFGFEYISRTTFREINLGDNSQSGETLDISGKTYKTKGFSICSNCGKVMHGNGAKDHTLNCQYRDKPEKAKVLRVLYLYRQFESESIRFLMPDDNFWTTEGIHSFIAALQLGLQKKFGGEVGHLKTAICEEPQSDTTLRKSFLYLYDTVPGGTGYLRQLMRNPEEMKAVFNIALSIVRCCHCQDDAEKDGCYECLFAYRHSFDQDKTSRKRAQELLSTLIQKWPKLKETSQRLAQIKLENNFESELEYYFIEAIQAYINQKKQSESGTQYELRKEINGYYLKLGESAWQIQQQIPLGELEGVQSPSRTDFLIRPLNSNKQGKEIAIFTDGWEFHNNRITKDFQQRVAILRSNQYWCWSLTWNDVVPMVKSDYQCPNLISLDRQFDNASMQKNASILYQQYGCEDFAVLEPQNSFLWLMNYLEHPRQEQWQKWGALKLMGQANLQSLHQPQIREKWLQQMQTKLGDICLNDWNIPSNFLTQSLNPVPQLSIFSAIDITRQQKHDPSSTFVCLEIIEDSSSLNSGQKQAWHEGLRLLNLYQFLPHIFAITSTQYELPQPINSLSKLTLDSTNKLSSQWQELKRDLDEILYPFIEQAIIENLPIASPDYELENHKGKVLAQALLAWSEPKIALVEYPEDQEAFTQLGWFVQTIEENNRDPHLLIKKLGGL